MKNSTKEDWCKTVIDDLNLLEMTTQMDEIKIISKHRFKKMVNVNVQKEAFNYLNSVKLKHSKVRNIQHLKCEMQDY